MNRPNNQITRVVTIPERPEHAGMYAVKVRLLWVCPVCGEPRPDTVTMMDSWDGSRTLKASSWDSPCGHLIKYAQLLKEARVNGLNDALTHFKVELNHDHGRLLGLSISQGNLRNFLNQGLKLYASKREKPFEIVDLSALYWSDAPLTSDDFSVNFTLWTWKKKWQDETLSSLKPVIGNQLDLDDGKDIEEINYELDLELCDEAFENLGLSDKVLFIVIKQDQTEFHM